MATAAKQASTHQRAARGPMSSRAHNGTLASQAMACPSTPPSTKHVAGTNYCVVHPTIHPETGQIIVASALDNLGKGAAGAMVQCMNIMFGLPETAGLQTLGLFP